VHEYVHVFVAYLDILKYILAYLFFTRVSIHIIQYEIKMKYK